MVSFSGYYVACSIYNIECPAENLKILLRLFSMVNIRVIYDEIVDNEDVT